jgi:hypothetical protein
MLFHFNPRIRSTSARPRLPQELRSLQPLCNNPSVHPLPVTMRFLAESTSHAGQPLAVYCCSYGGCRIRSGWVLDRRTRRPFRLFIGEHKS